MSIFGFNILSIQDRAHLYKHARAMNPAAMLFYSQHGGSAAEFAATFPNCATILRHWPDDKIHKQETPAAWLNRVSNGVPESIYLYTTNEVGWSSELIKWHTDLVKLAITRKRRLTIMNMGAGQPQPDDWKAAKELITLCSQHRDLIIVGLHQYAGGVITSGLIGGDPTHIQLETWPSVAETRGMTRWHVGRQKFLYDQCKEWGIAPPRVVISEAGFDFLGDIGAWLNKLEFTPPNTSINGWHTLIKQWRKWWPAWDAETAYAMQMTWAADTLWNDVEAVLLFGYGDSGGWSAYDVSKAETLLTLLAAHNPAPIPVPPPIVNPPPPPSIPLPGNIGTAETLMLVGANTFPLQATPNIASSQTVGMLLNAEQVRIYRDSREFADALTWYWVVRSNTPANESAFGWVAYSLPPPIVVIDPPGTSAEGDVRQVAMKRVQQKLLRDEIAHLEQEITEILMKYLPIANIA